MENENRTEGYIHEAVRNGNIDQVREILESDLSCVNDCNFNFDTPLLTVYDVNGQLDDVLQMMQLLIDYGAGVNMRGIFNHSILHLSLRRKHMNGVQLLLKNGADPNSVVSDIIVQPREVSADLMRIVLEHEKIDSDVMKYSNIAPVDKAIHNVEFNVLKKVVALGFKTTNIYEQLLHLHDFSNEDSEKEQLIEYLLSHATEIDSHGHFTLKALKCYMVTYHHDKGHLDKCSLKKYLLERGIDDDDDLGDSDLHRAVRNGDKELVQSLLEKGSNVNARNNFGDTPLHLLFAVYEPIREEWVFDIAKLLIEYGANLRAHNFLDETPFYKAVAMLYKNMSATKNEVKMMLAKITGVHVTQDNFEEIVSEVPVAVKHLTYILTSGYDESVLKLHELIIAIAISNEQLVDRLLEIDRLPLESKNYCCEDVNVALFAAVDKNNYNIIKMLLKAGLRTNRYHGKLFLAIGLWTEQKLSMICLFWEFKDYLTFCYIMKQTIYEFFTGNYGPKKLLELLIFYFAIDLRLNTLYEELIPLKGLFKLDSKSANILTSCNSKLDKLKEEKIGIKSMFDLLMMPLDSLVELLNNPDYLDACQKIFSALDNKTELEYFEYAIKTRLDLAIEKRQLMDVAKKCLNWALQDILIPMKIYTLPHHITWKILSYLTMRDLERIAKNYLKK